MSSTFSRHDGPRRPRPVTPPRMGHYYLNLGDRRLFCLNETARELLRESIPINASDLERQPLLHLDGTPVGGEALPLFAAVRDRQAREATFLWPRPTCLPLLLSWSAAPLTAAGGAVVGVSATVVLGPHEPDWGELAGLAHDLRTPLQAVRLLVPIAQTIPQPEVMTDVLQRLRSSAERAMEIAQDLLAWCKAPVQAAQRVTRDWIALDGLLQSLAAEQETTARSKGIGLEADLAAIAGIEVYTSRLRLGRLLGNLLTNAVRYTSVGRVKLSASWRTVAALGGQALVIAVEDTGSGLSGEDQDSIFQPYHRGTAGLADSDSGGSGVGLATVDRLVGELELRMDVSSQAGQGSRFELLVPRDLLRRRV